MPPALKALGSTLFVAWMFLCVVAPTVEGYLRARHLDQLRRNRTGRH